MHVNQTSLNLIAADLARRRQLEKRVNYKIPTVPECVCSDWQVVEHDWDTLPAKPVSSDKKALPLPPETWIG